jgi:predicted phosphodiesterase
MIKRNITTIAACLILFFLLFVIISEAFSANNNKSRQKKSRPADNVAGKLIMGQMPQGVILGRPADTSITVNVYAQQNMEFYIEYGMVNSKYDKRTGTCKLLADSVQNVAINSLKPDTKYYYRICCKEAGKNDFTATEQYSFHTCRSKGSDFCFVVQADSHLDEQSDVELYKRTLSNELADKPDFMIDLGDTSMVDKLQDKTAANIEKRFLMQRGFFSTISHSVPLFLVKGNHDGLAGWDFNRPENSLGTLSQKAFKSCFPALPSEDFYHTAAPDNGGPQNYYAWNWGDALFVVLDPYQYTVRKPGKTVDNWGWTLGDAQYHWFKDTLGKSQAKFKFIFCHQIVGGKDTDGRGGAEFAKYYEMGGLNDDESWGFDKNRPGWEKPIHQLMVDNKVNIFFHGHDHFFAKQQLDGVIYQLVPQPSHPNFKNAGQADSYGYTTGDILPNSGHIRVTVSESKVTVDYVRSYLAENEIGHRKNDQVDCSYTIQGK